MEINTGSSKRHSGTKIIAVIGALLIHLPRSLYGFQGAKQPDGTINEVIVQAANHHQVEVELVKAIIMVESGYNIRAVSKRGALGLMQLMPKTAEALGVDDCFDPAENVNAGVRYFQRLKKRFDGNIIMALYAFKLNIFLAALKGVLAVFSGSLAVTTGAIDSISDAVASLGHETIDQVKNLIKSHPADQ